MSDDDLVAKVGPMKIYPHPPSNAVWCEGCADWIERGASCPHYEVLVEPLVEQPYVQTT